MNKKIVFSLAALLMIAGCSNQPNLENAKEVNQTKKVNQIEKNKSNKTTQSNENNMSLNKVSEGNVSVNTENAEVETQPIPESSATVIKKGINNEILPNEESVTTVNTENNKKQDLAKELSSIIVYFDFDKYNIRKDQWPKVEKLAKLIKEHNNNYTVRIEGNCDEWGTEEYNYALGLKRANTVKNALIKLGVDPKKLTIISYGELNPVCTAHARWCWRLNRRDNFTYLP